MEDMKEVERHFTAKIEESKLLPEKAGTDINTRIKEANHLKDEIDGYFAEAFRAVKYLELEHEKLLF